MCSRPCSIANFPGGAGAPGIPWLTARELPELLYYRTSVERAGSPGAYVTVATPRGENWAVGSDELPGYRRFYTDDPHGNRLEFLTVRSDHGHSMSN